jgi:hypothetical protein
MSTTTGSTAVSSPISRWIESVSSSLHYTPGTMRLVQTLVIIAALFYAALSLSFYSYLEKAAHSIGHETEPSIIAAQNVRGLLGDAHANLADAFLLKEPQDGDHWRAYRDDMADVHDVLLDASQNITFGESERGPILTIMQDVGAYERLVGEAIDQGDGASLDEADALMRDKLLPAAVALDEANFGPLTRTWEDFTAHATSEIVIILLGSVTLLGILVFAQVFMFRKTRRILNPGLLLASVVFILSTVFLAFSCVHIRNTMRVAKEDAFDSIHYLWQTRAEAYAANVETSFLLLEASNGKEHAQRLAAFHDEQTKILAATPDQVAAALDSKTRLKGLLGDELANVTFDGEGEAALQTVEYWGSFVRVHEDLARMDVKAAAADPEKALELSQTIARSDLAFGSFDNSLEKTLDINENAFDNSIDKVDAYIGRLPWLFAITTLLVIVSAVVGFRPRINKYRF